jgi:hypothetical protein
MNITNKPFEILFDLVEELRDYPEQSGWAKEINRAIKKIEQYYNWTGKI